MLRRCVTINRELSIRVRTKKLSPLMKKIIADMKIEEDYTTINYLMMQYEREEDRIFEIEQLLEQKNDMMHFLVERFSMKLDCIKFRYELAKNDTNEHRIFACTSCRKELKNLHKWFNESETRVHQTINRHIACINFRYGDYTTEMLCLGDVKEDLSECD